MIRLQTLVFLLYSMLFLALSYLAILVTAYQYENIKALEEIVYCDLGFYRLKIALSETQFLLFRTVIYASFGTLLLLFWINYRLRIVISSELRALWGEAKSAYRSAKHRLHQLSGKEWLTIVALFGVTAIVKIYFLLHYPLHTDETASYDYFVMEGIEAVTAYYPIPNNHVFQNLLNWVWYQLNSDLHFSVRGTSYLIGLSGLLLLFFLLYFITNFRTAAVFAFMTGASYMPFYLSITGRGYSLILILAGIGFICTYYIIREESTYKRLAYFVLMVSSILGMYTVPTYLYTFATYLTILVAAHLLRKQYYQAVIPAAVCAIAGLVTVALYSPILVITGAKALFGNPYVAKDTAVTVAKYKDTSAMLSRFIDYIISLEGNVVGQDRFGYIIVGLTILIATALILANVLSVKQRLLCMMAIAGMLMPYVFIVLQRMLPPERTMVYKSFYFFLLAAIIADTVIKHYLRNRRTAAISLSMFVVLYAAYEVRISHIIMLRQVPQEKQRQFIWEKVMQDAPSTMYITEAYYQLFFLHYAKLAGKEIRFSSEFEEGESYDVLIIEPDVTLPDHVLKQYTRIYQGSELLVYRKSQITSTGFQSFSMPYLRTQ